MQRKASSAGGLSYCCHIAGVASKARDVSLKPLKGQNLVVESISPD